MIEILDKQSLAPWTSWKIGGPADHLCFPRTVDDVVEAMGWALTRSLPLTVLGAGSNVLISDRGIEGLVLCNKFLNAAASEEQIENEVKRLKIEALAGTPKSELTKVFLRYKLSPGLFLCGLPGDVAGGVVMNAGVSEDHLPREFCEIVDWVEVARPVGKEIKIVRIPANQLHWSYRNCQGWQPGVIVRVGLSWPLSPDQTVIERVKVATRNRVLRQPLDLPSCGSVFKNPGLAKAGALIEQSGLKGFTRGGAQVSPKHANFIVNTGSATAEDVAFVIQHVQATVRERFQIDLQTEVKYLGRW